MTSASTISKLFILFALAWLSQIGAAAQCPQVYDFYGAASSSPYWYSCTGASFSFNLQSPDNWGAYSVDWGDGTPVTTGASWTSPQIINHNYAQAIDTFVVTITELSSGCIVSGVVVMEKATSASIQIPVGGLTQACAPQVMEFINSSTNVSETTVFTWDFGDGTAPLTFDHTNWLQTISHLYDVGTVDCETQVTLTAENYCNIIQGGRSTATFNPIRIWDLDDAAISASATLLCYPDTTVTFSNTTERNCLFQGNIYQRYEYWNLGDYWGLGHDSIIDWTPWPPTFPHTIHFPGVGSYSISMLDSNYCGIAPAAITIQIVPPPVAGIAADRDTVCLGESITFFQNATGGANSYAWNFGNGSGWLPTGNGNITFTFDQPGSYLVQSRVAVTGSSSGCSDIDSVRVWVMPRPSVDILVDHNRGCDSLTVQYTPVSAEAVEWEWTFEAPPNNYSGETPPPVFYDGPGQYTTHLTVTGTNGCSATDHINVRVFASPVAAFTAMNLCEGDTAHFFDASASSGNSDIETWAWNFGDGNTSTSQNPSHFFPAGDYTVSLQVFNGNCYDTTSQFISVRAATQASIGLNIDSGCSPLDVQFSNQTADATSYYWNFGDGTFSTDSIPIHTFYNTTNSDTTYRVVMNASNAFGCGGSDTLYVTVHQGAIASFTDNANPPGCSPFQAIFTNTSQNATSFLWDLGDGTTATTVNATNLYINTTGLLDSYDITLYAYTPNGCNDTVMHTILVYPLADFDFTLSSTVGCSPLTLTMPYISGAQSYNWNFGDGSTSNFPLPTHSFTNTTNAPVTYAISLFGQSAFGCVDTAYAQVTVNPAPLAQFVADAISGCGPLTVNFTNLSLGNADYSWQYGDGNTSTDSSAVHAHTFVNNSTTPITFNTSLTATSSDGCVSTYNVPIQVFPAVVASFVPPAAQCTPANFYFNNNSTNANSYTWDFGNGMQSTDVSPNLNLINNSDTAQIYQVGLLAYSNYGCQSLFYAPIRINPLPNADFTLSASVACAPAPITITNLSTNADTYFWNYGDGSSSSIADTNHIHNFLLPINGQLGYTINLTATTLAGCSDTVSHPFMLYPSVTAAFTSNPGGCSPYPATFINQSIGASNFEWSFGDGAYSSENNPNHTYTIGNTTDQSFVVELVAISDYGCSDTVSTTLDIYHSPIAVAQIDSSFGCYPRTITFYNGSIGADSYQWVYGTGAVSDTSATLHNFTYYNFGTSEATYNAVLNAYTNHGCQASDEISISVAPPLQADFSVNAQGCTPLHVTFDNNSDGALSYFWDFGDGDISNQTDPEHTFFNYSTNDTIYHISLIVQNNFGCTDTADAFVSVYTRPVASFTATPESQIWPSATVSIINTTIGGTLTEEWNMGDMTTLYVEQPGDYTYGQWGEYNIRLIVSNGSCSDTAFQHIEILAPPPVAGFTGPAEGCAPLTVQFENTSEYAMLSSWQFGDGGTANATNPVYTYYQPGTYTVTLTVTGPDGSTDQMVQEQIIHVYASAVAAFTVTPNQVNVPSQPVYCLNLSQNATTYTWDFGDGSSSNEVNPIYYYTEEGVFDVTLIANNANNCPDTMVVVGAVHAKAGGLLDFPNAFTPKPSGGNGGSYDPTGFENDVFFPMSAGIDDYKLQIFNKWGELLFESNSVNVGWDGYYRGQLCKQDVYVWKCSARFVDGQIYEQAGDVTLLVK